MLIYKTFYSVAFKSDLRTLDVSHSSQPTSETTGKGFIHTSYQNNMAMDDPVRSYGNITRGLVSKETVVLRRWGRETQSFGFIN